MIVKILVCALLFFMIYNLFRAGVIMIKNEPDQPSMSKFIGRRVFTSAIIIVLLIIAVATGLVEPNPRPY